MNHYIGGANAKKRGVKNIFCSTFDDKVIIPGSVSSVGIFDVLEHIKDEDAFLQAIRSGLSTGGKLYVTVPAHQCLWSESDDRGHCRRYCMKTLTTVLQRNGFDIKYVSYFFWFLAIPIFFLRTIPYRIHKLLKKENNRSTVKRSQFIMPEVYNTIINSFLHLEFKRIEKGKTIRFGASLIVAAEKNDKL